MASASWKLCSISGLHTPSASLVPSSSRSSSSLEPLLIPLTLGTDSLLGGTPPAPLPHGAVADILLLYTCRNTNRPAGQMGEVRAAVNTMQSANINDTHHEPRSLCNHHGFNFKRKPLRDCLDSSMVQPCYKILKTS